MNTEQPLYWCAIEKAIQENKLENKKWYHVIDSNDIGVYLLFMSDYNGSPAFMGYPPEPAKEFKSVLLSMEIDKKDSEKLIRKFQNFLDTYGTVFPEDSDDREAVIQRELFIEINKFLSK